ncbi:MAG: O-antigen ligase family protein, partial [Anaerolineales bacterium]|nr:O-antigen ligase family protein [Anaerolineales bacterium]
MRTNINQELKNLNFSNSFFLWFSTLFFLPLTLYFRFVIDTSLVINKIFSAYKQTAWILGLVFFLWLLWKWLFDDRLISTGIEKYILAFCLVACISTIFSYNPSLSLERLIDISPYILGIYLLLDLKRFPNLWQGIINALLITAGVSSLLILISTFPWITLYQITPSQILSNPVYLLNILPRLPYSLGLLENVTAGYLVMIIPMGFYQFFQSKNIFWKVLQVMGLFLNLSVLLLTQSRGGLLGLFLMIFTLALFYRKNLVSYIFKNKIRITLTAVPVLTFLVGSIFLLSKTRGFSLVGRTLLIRYEIWLAAFRIFLESPWSGSGLGTFGMKYIEYRDPSDIVTTIIHAHNELIQISAELGILGVICLILIFWQVVRILRQQQEDLPTYSWVILAALGGLFGTLITEALFSSPLIFLLFLFYMVWLIPGGHDYPLPHKGRIYGGLSLVIVLVGIGYGWNIWKIQPYDQALQAAYENNWKGASAAMRTAQKRDPANPYYQHALGFLYGQVACQTGEDVDQALSYYQQSFDTYPNWGIDHANAGVLYAIKGDLKNAALQMEQAVINDPQQSFFSCLLGDYYLQLNEPEQALQSYSRCIVGNPQYLDSPYWQEDKNKIALTQLVIEQAESLLKDREDENMLLNLASLYLANNEIELAGQTVQEYLIENPDDLNGNIIHIKILEYKDDLSTVAGKIKQLLISSPRSVSLWTYQGKLALESADYKEAENAFTIGYRLSPSSYRAWILGNLYQVEGNLPKAQEFYQKALKKTLPHSGFSQNVAGRWPLPGLYVDCMPKTNTYTEYYYPAYQAAEHLADQDCTQAACIYQQLLLDNP